MLHASCWPRSGFGRILLTSFLVVLFMVLSRHYLPSVHESADKLVSQYAPGIHPHQQPQDEVPEIHPDEVVATSEESVPAHTQSVETPAATYSSKQSMRGCPVVPPAEDYLVSMKTGATELFAKLPEQLLTTLRCIPNYMIFSDIEQDVGDYHVYGALEDVSDKYKYSHPDFEYYRRLLDLAAKGQDLSLLANMNLAEKEKHEAWNLDKWKFVPIAHRVYVKHPKVKWYIFLEADSYMAWPNVLELLAQYDSDHPWYLGAVHFYGDVAYAQGGMGYFVSNGAMRLLDKIYDHKHIAHWERETAENPFGDAQIAATLRDAGCNLTGAPGLYGDPPTWFEFHADWWCEPAVSWHHMHASDVEALSQVETRLSASGESSYVYRDLFTHLVEPHLAPIRYDWDNLSRDRICTGPEGVHGDEGRDYKEELRWEELEEQEREDIWKDLDEERKEMIEVKGIYVRHRRWDELSDVARELAFEELTSAEKEAHLSVKQCLAACEEWDECKQYFYMTGRCHLQRAVRLGHYMESRHTTADEDLDGGVSNRTVSGWMMDRIRDMTDRAESCKPVSAWMKHFYDDQQSHAD